MYVNFYNYYKAHFDVTEKQLHFPNEYTKLILNALNISIVAVLYFRNKKLHCENKCSFYKHELDLYLSFNVLYVATHLKISASALKIIGSS